MELNTSRDLTLIFDVDGTLYNLKLLQTLLVFDLFILILFDKTRIKHFFLIYRYRTYRDSSNSDDCSLSKIKLSFCEKEEISVEFLQNLLLFFTEQRVKPYLKFCKRNYVISLIKFAQTKSIKVCFLSDYPIAQKLKWLNVKSDAQRLYSAEDPRIDSIKPNLIGLRLLLEEESVQSSAAVLIGDSVERDGKVARGLGVNFMTINRRNIRKLYKVIVDMP